MAAPLPKSLSPHVCVLESQDLSDLLDASGLPPLSQILQSFSPLPQVTTRTTALASVAHGTFSIRFSNLHDIEDALREDENQRAARTLDWIGERVTQKSAKWVSDLDNVPESDTEKTPWWEELKACVEGDHIPNRYEGWNHPMSTILAVSTTVANPLQTISTLHARMVEFPPWVDTSSFKFTLIVHPHNSKLSEEEATALFNAVKKQFGLDAYLLTLELPTTPPAPIAIPSLLPRLPPISITDSTPSVDPNRNRTGKNTLSLTKEDVQQTAKFTRQFVSMSLIPWMERCVLDWNEAFAANRRLLPSRFFSSTRRLFGSSNSPSPAPTPPPTHTPQRSQTAANPSSTTGGIVTAGPSQQRRLAEFATILGDLKLAISVWETLRKEGKGGSEILPMLLAPSPALSLLAQASLQVISSEAEEIAPQAQIQSLAFAVRWEINIRPADFSSTAMEGERWLVWAAGSAEEPSSAILLAHAALISARKQARNRAALWYLASASRLEKCGIKPLTMYFLRKAQHICRNPPARSISPLYWDALGSSETSLSDTVLPAIEHPLGRLLYTTGDVSGAIRTFLNLLRDVDKRQIPGDLNSPDLPVSIDYDKVFLEDFRVAYEHFKTTLNPGATLPLFPLPFNFCKAGKSKIRLLSDGIPGTVAEWAEKEQFWRSYQAPLGSAKLAKSGKAQVNETFWVDLFIQNPLDTEVNLARLSVHVESSQEEAIPLGAVDCEVEIIPDVFLKPYESRTIPVAVKIKRPCSITCKNIVFDFLSMLPVHEGLSAKGRRLSTTPHQRQNLVYAPDTFITIDVIAAAQKLDAQFVDTSELKLYNGEKQNVDFWLTNVGAESITKAWIVAGPSDILLINSRNREEPKAPQTSDTISSPNIVGDRQPLAIALSDPILPGSSVQIGATFCADDVGLQRTLSLLVVYQGATDDTQHSTRLARLYSVTRSLNLSIASITTVEEGADHAIELNISNPNEDQEFHITQITCLSPLWQSKALSSLSPKRLDTLQSVSIRLSCAAIDSSTDVIDSLIAFVTPQLRSILNGQKVEKKNPPPIRLQCNYVSENPSLSLQDEHVGSFAQLARKNVIIRNIGQDHPHIPKSSIPYIFPLYNPYSLDIIVFWSIPSEGKIGQALLSYANIGSGHMPLSSLITEAENTKATRNMYAETQQEKAEILEAVKQCDWNADTDPLVLNIQDGVLIEHDFTKGGCHATMEFSLRNTSLTHDCKYTFALSSSTAEANGITDILPPPLQGLTKFVGRLRPSESATRKARLWATQAGTYGFGTWKLQSSVGLDNAEGWQVQQTYLQESTATDQSCLVIKDLL